MCLCIYAYIYIYYSPILIKKMTCETQKFYILLALLLITNALLTAIYCYLIKYHAKQKHLFLFQDTKLKQVYIDNIN